MSRDHPLDEYLRAGRNDDRTALVQARQRLVELLRGADAEQLRWVSEPLSLALSDLPHTVALDAAHLLSGLAWALPPKRRAAVFAAQLAAGLAALRAVEAYQARRNQAARLIRSAEELAESDAYLSRRHPAEAAAFEAREEWCAALLELLAATPRSLWDERSEDLARLAAGLTSVTGWAASLERLARSPYWEELVVLHRWTRRGFRVRVSNVTTLGALHVLLAHTLVGAVDEEKLPGKRPPPEMVSFAAGLVRPEPEGSRRELPGTWGLWSWDGLIPSRRPPGFDIPRDGPLGLGSLRSWRAITPFREMPVIILDSAQPEVVLDNPSPVRGVVEPIEPMPMTAVDQWFEAIGEAVESDEGARRRGERYLELARRTLERGGDEAPELARDLAERALEEARRTEAARLSAGCHGLLGRALWLDGRDDEAEEHLERALELDGETPGPVADRLSWLRQLSLILRDAGRATDLYRLAADAMAQDELPAIERAWFGRLGAEEMAAHGEPLEAEAMADEALALCIAELGPDHPVTIRMRRGLHHHHAGEPPSGHGEG